MDPLKPASTLDPKLKETYDRIMGNTPSGPAQTPPPAGTSQTQPRTQSILEPPPNVNPFPKPPVEQTEPRIGFEPSQLPRSPLPPLPSKGQTVASPSMAPVSGTNTYVKQKQKGRSFSKMLLIIPGGVIFFIAYGVIWAKIFGFF